MHNLNVIPMNEVPGVILGVIRVIAQEALKAEALRHTAKTMALEDPLKGFQAFVDASEIDASGVHNLGPKWDLMCNAIKN